MIPFKANEEKKRITQFIKGVLKKTGYKKVVIGISGGIDSATSLFLAKEAIGTENIIALHLPYFKETQDVFGLVVKTAKVPAQNRRVIEIKSMADEMIKDLNADNDLRRGNIMARVRMIILFDQAKKYNALVCGTENRSEDLLGYFTRFGDAASDIEPLQHVYKTHVYKLAKYLGVPEKIIQKAPSANLWKGQTDEKEYGFSYEEADEILYLHFDKKVSLADLQKRGYKKAKKVLEYVKKNEFKHSTPYSLKNVI